MIPRGSFGLLYTNIAQIITHALKTYLATYYAIMLSSLLTYYKGIESQKVYVSIETWARSTEKKRMRDIRTENLKPKSWSIFTI